MRRIRLGIIGCGNRSKAHQQYFAQAESVEVVAIADPREERRLETAERLGCKRIYKDHTELLDNAISDGIDALLIAVEPTAHSDMEERAIEMGIPFLVEKPMELDLEKAERNARLIEEKGLITSVGFQDRYLDLINVIKDELPNHKRGGIVTGTWIGGIPRAWWWQKKSTCGGQLYEQNIHLADCLRYLYGEPVSVYAVASRGIVTPGVDASQEYDTDDHSTAVFRFPNNVTAVLMSGCYVSVRPNSGMIISHSDVVFDYRLRNNLITRTAQGETDVPRRVDQTALLDEAFVNALITGDKSYIRSDYVDALKTHRMCMAANRSMETGEVIYL